MRRTADRARRWRPTWSSRSTTWRGWRPGSELQVRRPLARLASVAEAGRDLRALLARERRADTEVLLRPVMSPAPSGTTLRVELLAERRASELRVEVTAEVECVRVRAHRDGVEALDRTFYGRAEQTPTFSPRRSRPMAGIRWRKERSSGGATGGRWACRGGISRGRCVTAGEPTILVRARPALAAASVAEVLVHALATSAAEARPSRSGLDRRLHAGCRLPCPPRGAAPGARSLGGAPHLGRRRPFRPARRSRLQPGSDRPRAAAGRPERRPRPRAT